MIRYTGLLLPVLLMFAFSACRPRLNPSSEAARVDSLIVATTDDMRTHPTEARQAYRTLQSQLTDSIEWYRVAVYLATLDDMTGDSVTARQRYDDIERWCRAEAGRERVAGLLSNHRGVRALDDGDMTRASEYFKEAFELLNRSPKGRDLISATINLADNCFVNGDLPLTAYYYRYALYLCDSLGDGNNRTPIYSGLAQTYTELRNFKVAHQYFKLAEETIHGESVQTRFFYYFTLGGCYYYERRYDRALELFSRAATLAVANHMAGAQISCEGNMAEVLLMSGRYADARRHLLRCDSLIRSGVPIPDPSRYYLDGLWADLYIAEGRPAEARRYLPPNIDSLMAGSPRYLMLHYSRLEGYAVRDGKWRQAYHYRALSDHYADTLANQQASNNVYELAQRYSRDTTLLHQRIVLESYRARDNRQQTIILLIVAGSIVLTLIIIIVVVINRRRLERRLSRQRERVVSLRMDVVRNRVSPHYIFNVLGTILPLMKRDAELSHAVELLIDVLRGNLMASGKEATLLWDEIKLVRRFVELYHRTQGERPRVTWHIDKGLKKDRRLSVPSMALQIPVENALKHAFPTLTDESEIVVTIRQEAGTLYLEVCDNGCGYDPGRVKGTDRDTGTGLQLLSHSLMILNRYNRQKACLAITNLMPPRQGTCVTLSLPEDYVYTLPEGITR